jgi:hypothetical protein
VAERDINVKVGRDGPPPNQWGVGRAFAYQSAIWRIKGLYLTGASSGRRQLWWILGEQEAEVTELDTGGKR